MLILYRALLHLYRWVTLGVAAFGHSKARRARAVLAAQHPGDYAGQVVWIHAASAGEGNQAIPLAEAFRALTGAPIVISFSSPSGYDFHRQDTRFDDVLLLPLDVSLEAHQFLDALQPRLAVFIRNELWLGYLQALKNRKIPAVLVNAPDHVAHRPPRWIQPYLRHCLERLTAVFPAHEDSDRSFARSRLKGPYGDTKWEIPAPAHQPDERLQDFTRGSVCVVAGSTWPKEENMLAAWFEHRPEGTRLILAPHEVNPASVARLQGLFPGAVRLSQFRKGMSHGDVLLLDGYGLLRHAYACGHVAVVGGGFGRGIHNVLEPACQGLPVVHGPNRQKFPEADTLAALGAGFAVNNRLEMENVLNTLVRDGAARKRIAEALAAEFAARRGYAERLAREVLRATIE